MDSYKFLSKVMSSKPQRPILTWGFVTEIEGKPVAWAADGYRIHLTWGEVPSSGGRIQFPNSLPIEEGAKPPKMQDVLAGCQPDTALLLDTYQLRQTLECIQRNVSATLIAKANRKVYLASDNALFQLDTPGDFTPPVRDVTLSFDPSYMLGALDKKREVTPVEFNAASLIPDEDDKANIQPFRVGWWLDQCAVIMPMSGDSFNPMLALVLS